MMNLQPEKKLDIYKKLFFIRKIEEELIDYYYKNKIMSFVHFYVGQEAVAVGICENLELSDKAFGNHRSHGHYLAKGGNPYKMVCELLGKKDGCCAGKGGSMHMIDKSVNFVGSTPILGSVVPIAAGSAFTQKLTNSNDITAVFYGDGASEEGVSYETLNFSALHKLPLLFVLENNLYSVMSKLEDRRSNKYDLQKICDGFGVRYVKADGNDLYDVYSKVKDLVHFIRNGNGPCLIECITYRHMAHSAPITDDKLGYRQIDTIEERKRRDCVANMRSDLLGSYSDDYISSIEDSIVLEIKQTIENAEKANYPTSQDLLTDVYYE